MNEQMSIQEKKQRLENYAETLGVEVTIFVDPTIGQIMHVGEDTDDCNIVVIPESDFNFEDRLLAFFTHELGHILNNDVEYDRIANKFINYADLVSYILSLIVVVLTLLLTENLILLLPLGIVAFIIPRLIFYKIMKLREYLADEFAAQMGLTYEIIEGLSLLPDNRSGIFFPHPKPEKRIEHILEYAKQEGFIS